VCVCVLGVSGVRKKDQEKEKEKGKEIARARALTREGKCTSA